VDPKKVIYYDKNGKKMYMVTYWKTNKLNKTKLQQCAKMAIPNNLAQFATGSFLWP